MVTSLVHISVALVERVNGQSYSGCPAATRLGNNLLLSINATPASVIFPSCIHWHIAFSQVQVCIQIQANSRLSECVADSRTIKCGADDPWEQLDLPGVKRCALRRSVCNVESFLCGRTRCQDTITSVFTEPYVHHMNTKNMHLFIGELSAFLPRGN